MRVTLKKKIISLAVGATILPTIVIIAFVVIQKHRTNAALTEELSVLAQNSISRTALDVYGLCETANDLIQQRVDSDLKVARQALGSNNQIRLASEKVVWQAINQGTKEPKSVTLPKLTVGGKWLGQNQSLAAATPVVDEVKELTGSTCTIFEKMNADGDMLRVATNIETKEHTRAIGTYIAARNGDGTPNPVIESVMSGQTYHGRAFVVNAWYVTAYEPIKDSGGTVIGMLYVGVKQEAVESLRKTIGGITVGKTGYVYVIGGSGEQQGHYILSKDGARDGENIWEAKDSDGRFFIQSIVNKGLKLGKGQVDYETYPWKNKDEATSRKKIAAIAYYAPWDWVIGVGAYEDDFNDARKRTESALAALLRWSVVGGLIMAALTTLLAFTLGGRIANPLKRVIDLLGVGADQITSASGQIAATSQSMAEGASEQAASIEESSASLEEMSSMTQQSAESSKAAAVLMGEATQLINRAATDAAAMDNAMTEIKTSSDHTSKIIKTIDEIAFQTNLLALNAAVEAARAGEAGKGFAVVAEEVRNLAMRSAEAAKNTSQLIENTLSRVSEGVRVVGGLKESLGEVTKSSSKISGLVQEIAAGSAEQAQGISQISIAISQMDKVTQQTAASAEENASASEELAGQSESIRSSVMDLVTVVNGQTN